MCKKKTHKVAWILYGQEDELRIFSYADSILIVICLCINRKDRDHRLPDPVLSRIMEMPTKAKVGVLVDHTLIVVYKVYRGVVKCIFKVGLWIRFGKHRMSIFTSPTQFLLMLFFFTIVFNLSIAFYCVVHKRGLIAMVKENIQSSCMCGNSHKN